MRILSDMPYTVASLGAKTLVLLATPVHVMTRQETTYHQMSPSLQKSSQKIHGLQRNAHLCDTP